MSSCIACLQFAGCPSATACLPQGNCSHVERILLANLPKLMLDWFQEILKLAVGPAAKDFAAGPPVFEGGEMKEWAKTGWVQYENLVVINDRWGHLKCCMRLYPMPQTNMFCGFWRVCWQSGTVRQFFLDHLHFLHLQFADC